ncbi:MAG: methylmalonyl-CoA mutase [Roseibium sp.]|uniref:methylmalonyl-CoA mutase family protein n=1 Tax=Roseibium sp. TaxID=1936156 RepID=UPI002639EE18|nr:methylmalonyl-CoA mutase family protein [Roseibium sp.]MCV0427677.1 methylmalonyl-CoA mutase [Roseibium sp.]
MPLSFTGPDSFYSADEEAWWASVDKALKGTSRQRLFGTTDDGLEIAPLYAGRTDTPSRALRSENQDWSIVQRIDIADPSAANAQILEDLEGGASGLELVLPGTQAGRGYGTRVCNLPELETLFHNVQLELINLRLEAGQGSAEALALVLAYLEKRKIDPALVKIASGFDPFGQKGVLGPDAVDLNRSINELRDMAEAVQASGSPARLLKSEGSIWYDAGATPGQELALVLASAAAQLRLLEKTKLEPEVWASRISMNLVANADQFGTIAKARAIRALWANVLDGAGLPQSPMQLHMSTSYRMLTRRDPWVNLLRNTVATFAAGVGGADSVCVLPHTLAVGLPDGFARRLARNTQSILLEESNLSKVMDPAAGSGAIEDRTEKLCAIAWAFFQEIEAAGGIAEALRQGLVQKRIGSAKAELDESVARRKRPITGVSEFPDLAETNVKVLQDELVETSVSPIPQSGIPEPGEGEWFSALKSAAAEGKALLEFGEDKPQEDLTAHRLAEPFEKLRAAADALEIRTGKVPTVFLASLGSLAQFTARATWTANAFAAGGVKAVGPAIYKSHDDLLMAFKESGAALACLVSSDEVYETEAADLARALKAAGAKHLYLAGKPGAQEAAYSEAGIDTYLHAGCNLLALLEDAHAQLNAVHGADQSDLEVL